MAARPLEKGKNTPNWPRKRLPPHDLGVHATQLIEDIKQWTAAAESRSIPTATVSINTFKWIFDNAVSYAERSAERAKGLDLVLARVDDIYKATQQQTERFEQWSNHITATQPQQTSPSSYAAAAQRGQLASPPQSLQLPPSILTRNSSEGARIDRPEVCEITIRYEDKQESEHLRQQAQPEKHVVNAANKAMNKSPNMESHPGRWIVGRRAGGRWDRGPRGGQRLA